MSFHERILDLLKESGAVAVTFQLETRGPQDSGKYRCGRVLQALQ